MRILYYLQQFPAYGGIEVVTATVANRFAELGHDVYMISHLEGDGSCIALRLDPRIHLQKMPERANYSKANRDFLQGYIRDNGIDVVIFQDSYAQVERNLFPNETQAKVIVCEHNMPYCAPAPEEISRLRDKVRRIRFEINEAMRKRYLYKHCDRYVLLSKYFYGDFRALARLSDTRKLRAIPNPMSPNLLRREVLKEKEILMASTLSPGKGAMRLVRVWQKIALRHEDWRITIIGDGEERKRIEDFIRNQRIPRVHIDGYQPDPSKYFARASIYAMMSRREGWGLVLVEAMANGCVPVAFDSYGAVHDIISEGADGVTVPAFDEDSFASSLDFLMTHPETLLRYRARGIESARRYEVENVVDKAWGGLLRECT